jgi:hypothetical protein
MILMFHISLAYDLLLEKDILLCRECSVMASTMESFRIVLRTQCIEWAFISMKSISRHRPQTAGVPAEIPIGSGQESQEPARNTSRGNKDDDRDQFGL